MTYNMFVSNQDIVVPVLSLRKIFIFWSLYSLYQTNIYFWVWVCYIRNMYMLVYISVADPEGPLPGGVTKSARSAEGGGWGRGIPPPAGGGPGGLPRENFWKMDANGAFWAHFLPSLCRFFLQKLCVIFAFKAPIFRYTLYVMRENFHLLKL